MRVFMSFDVNNTKVQTYLDKYLVDNAYSAENYQAPRFYISIGRIILNFPNPGMLHYHDLHHVVSGYGTGLVGEAEVSAYELRSGCPSFLIFIFCIGSICIGLALSPVRVLKAWRIAKGTHTLYRSSIPYQTLIGMEIADLRLSLNIPPRGFGK